MQAQKPPTTVQSYLQQKKIANRDTTIGVVGTDSMIFNDYGKSGGRGISTRDKVMYNHYDQRAKQLKFYEDQRELAKIKKQQEYEATKSVREAYEQKQKEEKEQELKILKEIENNSRLVVDHSIMTGNDAW